MKLSLLIGFPLLLLDFSTLYAPLIRDGRMEKFYWEPTRKIELVLLAVSLRKMVLTKQRLSNSLIRSQASQLTFGALRSRVYDEQVREFINQVGLNKVSVQLVIIQSLQSGSANLILGWLTHRIIS